MPICTFLPNQTYAYSVNDGTNNSQICVSVCPNGFYGDNTTWGNSEGRCQKICQFPYFGDPNANLCVLRCPYSYYGSSLTTGRPCVLNCPEGEYAINLTSTRVCVTTCDDGYWADNYTRTCYNIKTLCQYNTFADITQRKCVIA